MFSVVNLPTRVCFLTYWSRSVDLIWMELFSHASLSNMLISTTNYSIFSARNPSQVSLTYHTHNLQSLICATFAWLLPNLQTATNFITAKVSNAQHKKIISPSSVDDVKVTLTLNWKKIRFFLCCVKWTRQLQFQLLPERESINSLALEKIAKTRDSSSDENVNFLLKPKKEWKGEEEKIY